MSCVRILGSISIIFAIVSNNLLTFKFVANNPTYKLIPPYSVSFYLHLSDDVDN